jgi:hypothetical protein
MMTMTAGLVLQECVVEEAGKESRTTPSSKIGCNYGFILRPVPKRASHYFGAMRMMILVIIIRF